MTIDDYKESMKRMGIDVVLFPLLGLPDIKFTMARAQCDSVVDLKRYYKYSLWRNDECKCSVCLEPFDDCDEFARAKLINYHLRNKRTAR